MLLSTAFTCLLYFTAIALIYSNHRKELNQFVFAFLAFLFPSILINSNFGADLLALSFLLLALESSSTLRKGFLFALASLARYNYILFVFVFLFDLRKKPKNIPLFFAAYLIPWIPWMIYNYLFTGNPIFSVWENFFLNVQSKALISPIAPDQIFIIALFLLLAFLAWREKKKVNQLNGVSILGSVMFLISGIKETRFINMLVPSIAFNAAFLAKQSSKKKKFLHIFVLVLIGLFLMIFFTPSFNFFKSPVVTPILVAQDDFIKECRVASDKWVYFYEKGIIAEVVYDIPDLNKFVSSGGSLVLYSPSSFDLSNISAERIDRGEYTILKSSSCAPQPKKYISGSLRHLVLKHLKDTNSSFYDYSDWYED